MIGRAFARQEDVADRHSGGWPRSQELINRMYAFKEFELDDGKESLSLKTAYLHSF